MLIVSRQAPWAGPAAREALDIALAGGAFGLPLAILFLDDGVFQLQQGQAPAALEQKNLCANLQALDLFGVEAVYACQHSLHVRGLAAGTLAVEAQPLAAEAITALFNRFDEVITL
nr:sulfurtransferase complex subunit TusC [Pseudomonas typographi]